MSELINNREHRQKVLKEIIKELHNGKAVDDVKARFAELIEGVSTAEISEMECIDSRGNACGRNPAAL